MKKTDRERFTAKVMICPISKCWLWVGAKNNNGYGVFHMPDRRWQSHRYSWLLHKQEDPAKLCVCHTCDVPLCVNPEHLFLGTRGDNNKDAQRKGRLKGASFPGELHPSARLREADVLLIRASNKTDRELGRQLRVHPTTVNLARRGKTWKTIS